MLAPKPNTICAHCRRHCNWSPWALVTNSIHTLVLHIHHYCKPIHLFVRQVWLLHMWTGDQPEFFESILYLEKSMWKFGKLVNSISDIWYGKSLPMNSGMGWWSRAAVIFSFTSWNIFSQCVRFSDFGKTTVMCCTWLPLFVEIKKRIFSEYCLWIKLHHSIHLRLINRQL